MLASLLASHPEIISVGEYFIDHYQNERQRNDISHEQEFANLVLRRMMKKVAHGKNVRWVGWRIYFNL